jgi:hypothetical protein
LLNYNSTKVCFAYFGFYPRSDPGKKEGMVHPLPGASPAGKPNLLQACGALVI